MTQEDIIRMAREAGLASIYSACDEPGVRYAYEDWDEELERFAALVAAAERKEWPNLDPVITWLENGCDPKEAAKELRIYAAAIRARTP
jgi:hypothetical protein